VGEGNADKPTTSRSWIWAADRLWREDAPSKDDPYQPTEKAVIFAIVRAMQIDPETGNDVCFIRHSKIAKRAGCSVATVKRTIERHIARKRDALIAVSDPRETLGHRHECLRYTLRREPTDGREPVAQIELPREPGSSKRAARRQLKLSSAGSSNRALGVAHNELQISIIEPGRSEPDLSVGGSVCTATHEPDTHTAPRAKRTCEYGQTFEHFGPCSARCFPLEFVRSFARDLHIREDQMRVFEEVLADWRDAYLETYPPRPNDTRDRFKFWRDRFNAAPWDAAAFERTCREFAELEEFSRDLGSLSEVEREEVRQRFEYECFSLFDPEWGCPLSDFEPLKEWDPAVSFFPPPAPELPDRIGLAETLFDAIAEAYPQPSDRPAARRAFLELLDGRDSDPVDAMALVENEILPTIEQIDRLHAAALPDLATWLQEQAWPEPELEPELAAVAAGGRL